MWPHESAAHVYTNCYSRLYIHSLVMYGSWSPMERMGPGSSFCIYSLLVLFLALKEAFVKVAIFRVCIEARAGFGISIVTMAMHRAAIHLDQVIYFLL